MPEEKVKQYECLCPCEHETGCIACENGNHDYHIVPPAADAGPRQPCAVCGWPLADSVAKGCRPGNCSLRPLPLTAYDPQRANNEYGGLKLWAAAPPVPQEAAPQPPSVEWSRNHLAHVQRFLIEMYQTMVDPCDEFKGNIAELCELLLKMARDQREREHERMTKADLLTNSIRFSEQATAPDWAMRVAQQLGTCRTPHFLGKPTPDRKALTQIPHQELPQGLCRDWQAIDRVAATKEPQSRGQDGSTDSMQKNTAPVYMCPAGCGCLWRDNQDGTLSLYGPNSKSCEKCEYMPLKELTLLIREAGSERERRLTSVLFVIMSDMPKKRDWLDPDIEREASRLLGGES